MQYITFSEAILVAEEGRISVNVFIQIVTKQNRDVARGRFLFGYLNSCI